MAKLGKALMSLFLDKQAREALENKAPVRAQRPQASPLGAPGAPPSAPRPVEQAHPSREELYDRLNSAAETQAKRAASPDRQRLIEDALRVRASKAKILEDLPQEQRLKLEAMARMTFLKMKDSGNGS